MRIDRLGLGDLTELAGLVARGLEHDDLPAPVLRRKLLEDPDCDPRYHLAAREGDRLVGAALGLIRRQSDGPVGYVRLVATEPDVRRRGVATALLDDLERRLAEGGAARIEVGSEAPVFLFPGVEVPYTSALCFFQRRGYVRHRDATNLAVGPAHGDFDTTAREAALRAEGFVSRRLEESNRAALDRCLASRWPGNWHYEGLCALESSPATGFVALRQGQIVGFAVYDAARPGWFGPMYFYSTTVGARVCRVYWQYRKEPTRPA